MNATPRNQKPKTILRPSPRKLRTAPDIPEHWLIEHKTFPYIVLATITFLLYWRATGYQFVDYDDPFFVTQNIQVQAGLSLHSIEYAFTTLLGFYHPITWLSLMLDSQLAGLSASAFHLTNIWIHIANSFLVFRLLLRLFEDKSIAFAIAILFAVHPANVESVAWISERKGLLSAFFFLAAMLTYLQYLDRGAKRFALSTLSFYVLSLLSKPSYLFAYPLLLFAVVWFRRAAPQSNTVPRARSASCLTTTRCRLGLYTLAGCAASLSVAAGWVTIVAEANMGVVKPLQQFPMSERIVLFPMFYVASLRNVLLPQAYSPIFLWHLPAPFVLLVSVSFLAIFTLAVFELRKQAPWLWFGWLWFGAILLPVSGLVKFGYQVTADR